MWPRYVAWRASPCASSETRARSVQVAHTQKKRFFLRTSSTKPSATMLDDEILEDAGVIKCIEEEGEFTIKKEIINTDRCATARVAGAVAGPVAPVDLDVL